MMNQFNFKIGLELHKQLMRSVLDKTSRSQVVVNKPIKFLVPEEFYDCKEKQVKIIHTYSKSELKHHCYTGKTISRYELDEMPPSFNELALGLAKATANLLNLDYIKKSIVMRKEIYDGSIPAGFQRTMLCTAPNQMKSEGSFIINELYLEEDSCSCYNNNFDTDRCSIALLEIVTAPLELTIESVPDLIEQVKILNNKIDRELGLTTVQASIRQDVNIGYRDSIVEIKGVENIAELQSIVKKEISRLENLYNEIIANPIEIINDTLHCKVESFELVKEIRSILNNRGEEDLQTKSVVFKVPSQFVNLFQKYIIGDFSSTRGLNTDLTTSFNRAKGQRTRLVVETDLEPVQWDKVNLMKNEIRDLYLDLDIQDAIKIPYDTDLFNLLYSLRNKSILSKSTLNFLNSNFHEFLRGDLFENITLFCQLHSLELIDLSFMQNSVGNYKERLVYASTVDLNKIAMIAKREFNQLKVALKQYSHLITNKKKFIELYVDQTN